MIGKDIVTYVVFIDVGGRDVDESATNVTELRCPGLGWRWHDFDGNEWHSAMTVVDGERVMVWSKVSR